MQVSKKTFCALHINTKCRIEIYSGKISAGVLLATDGRRKHSNHLHSIQTQVIDCSRDHISHCEKVITPIATG